MPWMTAGGVRQPVARSFGIKFEIWPVRMPRRWDWYHHKTFGTDLYVRLLWFGFNISLGS